MAERETERKIHIRMTQDMHRRLRIRCAELDVTIQDYVVRKLDQALSYEVGDDNIGRIAPRKRKR